MLALNILADFQPADRFHASSPSAPPWALLFRPFRPPAIWNPRPPRHSSTTAALQSLKSKSPNSRPPRREANFPSASSPSRPSRWPSSDWSSATSRRAHSSGPRRSRSSGNPTNCSTWRRNASSCVIGASRCPGRRSASRRTSCCLNTSSTPRGRRGRARRRVRDARGPSGEPETTGWRVGSR